MSVGDISLEVMVDLNMALYKFPSLHFVNSLVLQATGVRLGMILQAISCIGAGLAIGFIFSWKYTLFILGIVPIMLMAVAIQMKLAKGFSGKNNKELERAGKVEHIK